MEITKEMIEEWRAVCEAATPGGWTTAVIIGEQYKCAVASKIGLVALDVRRSDDSAFIAAARTALPAALDALEAAWAEVARVKAERDAAVADCSGYCATCSFCGDCSKQDHNDAGEPSWCYGDCDCWEWRGVYAENTDAPTGAETVDK